MCARGRVYFEGSDVTLKRPTYRYGDVVGALREMVVWMLGQERLAETVCRLIMDGEWVGLGDLEKVDRRS